MRVLLDTNVILDRFLQRQPWYSDASVFWQRIDAGQIVGFITATTVTDIYVSPGVWLGPTLRSPPSLIA